ncbi:hypothetical protein [Labedaea rhizosphaerae]|uniref:hypothetical protein n=1 Tax=Labedaea rhizosphaerae TaxID=598644 RepID=UPI00105F7261|nr:hypothetical protein [Labedaea rhizosphaerae]
MAIVWCPLGSRTIDSVLALAEGSWARDGIDETWRAAGWLQPGRPGPAKLVFDEMTYVLDAGERPATIGMEFDPDRITSIALSFATFHDATDPADPDVADLVDSVYSAHWQADPGADRRRFDALWRIGYRELEARLDAPEAAGYHDEQWQYGVWRVDDTLITVYQGEDFESYSTMDSASVGLLRFPRTEKVPDGKWLYELMCGV